ncbi:lactone hydrolase [Pseudonocardia sulfidoxydans NBRC 16205]|uniref:Lactone hydrolase n=1 Tax=Pseudonocardia sulfidoxydans NBRC 16205 TaxID=1223511 RepID=A0A511DG74_9PSEU|nr:alpha/beta fold hydrolase [Pseudonocardia sulfidoxydans]GEL21998.1 lactone hydrolase [Pseudonocardia sulfidoxydans NBRC 16205]
MKATTARGTIEAGDVGEGRPVVLLHALALSGRLFDPIAAEWAPRRRVITPDARGHGGSDWDGRPFTGEDMADDVAALIETLVGGPADVIGMSMGGSTAVLLAQRRPDLVARLVLADATADYGPDRVQTWAERAEKAVNVPREKQVDFQIDRWFSPSFVEANADEVRRVCDIFVVTDSAAHAAACHALGTVAAVGELGTISAPTLVMVGDEDYATPPAMAEQLAAGIPDSRLEVLTATRHLSLIQRPDVWPEIEKHLDA